MAEVERFSLGDKAAFIASVRLTLSLTLQKLELETADISGHYIVCNVEMLDFYTEIRNRDRLYIKCCLF